MTYLLDTDHISILQRKAGAEYAALAARLGRVSPADIVFSVVSFHEQVIGCHAYINRTRDQAGIVRGYAMFDRVLDNFASAPVIPFDTAAAAAFDDLTARRVRLATMDLRIAAIALSRGLILLTRNARDFGRVPGLTIEDWTA